MGKVFLNELAAALADRHGISRKEAQQFLTAFMETVKAGIDDDKVVKIKGLGTFKVIDVDARESVNVNTGERVVIDGHQRLSFTPDTAMKELVNKPFSQFETVIINDGVEFPDELESGDLEEEALDVEDATDGVESAENPVEEPLFVEDAEPAKEQIPEDDVPVKEEEPQPENDSISSEKTDASDDDKAVGQNQSETKASGDVIEVVEIIEHEEEQTVPELHTPQPEVAEKTSDVQEKPLAETKEGPVAEPVKPAAEPVAPVVNVVANRHQGWWWAVAALACILCFGVGYWLGGRQHQTVLVVDKEAAITIGQQQVTAKAVSPAVTDAQPQPADSAKNAAAETAQAASDSVKSASQTADQTSAAQTSAAQNAQTSAATAKPATANWRKYEEMDRRIQYGAYGIVGTDTVLTAKEGETLGRISRVALGPDMECYMEVYNGLKASDVLKAGQKIRVPKLETKKKLLKKEQESKQ